MASSQAQREVVELAERLSIPVATSLNAKGTIPDQHPLSVGVCGTYSRWCANRVVAEADLVFFIGSHTGSQVTTECRSPDQERSFNWTLIPRSWDAATRFRSACRATPGPRCAKCSRRRNRVDPTPSGSPLCSTWCKNGAEVAPLAHSDASPIRPERLCTELTAWLPNDAVLVTDTGHSGIWTGTMVDAKDPNQTFIRCAGSWAGPSQPWGSSAPCPTGPWCASLATAASGTTWGNWRRRRGMASTP